MNQDIKNIIRRVWADRLLSVLICVLIVGAVGFCIYLAFAIKPSDLQLATRYTAFGETNYYRERWYYLLSFIGFGLVSTALNIALAIKVFLLEKRPFALVTLGGGFVILFITIVVTRSVLGIALL